MTEDLLADLKDLERALDEATARQSALFQVKFNLAMLRLDLTLSKWAQEAILKAVEARSPQDTSHRPNRPTRRARHTEHSGWTVTL